MRAKKTSYRSYFSTKQTDCHIVVCSYILLLGATTVATFPNGVSFSKIAAVFFQTAFAFFQTAAVFFQTAAVFFQTAAVFSSHRYSLLVATKVAPLKAV
jgi:hypothetical protein